MYRLRAPFRATTLSALPRRSLATTPRLLSDKPDPKAPPTGPADPAAADTEGQQEDPAARGVNEMRRQWGGLIDGAEEQLADEVAVASGTAQKPKGEGKGDKGDKAKVDMSKHEGLEGEYEQDLDPAARGVSEMRRQWGGLIDEKDR